MKNILVILISVISLLANESTIVSKKIDMGNNHYSYIDYDKEWNHEGTLRFSKNLQCYIVSSGNMSCMDGDYEQEVVSLKSIIFSDVDQIITKKKTLSKSKLENYKDTYENFGFKGSSYEGLFAYLFIVNNRYSKEKTLDIKQDVSKLLLIPSLALNSKKDLVKYNNMAFFLQEFGANKEAIFILKKIIEKFPNRTVAYLNLGDAYWGLENKEKAKKAYQTYIKQMKELGKEKKIPTVVFERVK